MTGAALRQFGISRSGWARAFWTVMFVGHAPAVGSAWASLFAGEIGTVRFAVLVASQILFLLKIFDLPFLRLPAAPRAKLAVISVVVLLHGDVIQRAATQDIDSPRAWTVMVVGVVASIAAAFLLGARRLDGVRPRLSRGQSRSALANLFEHVYVLLLPPRFLLLERACLINRAPPF